MRRCSGPCSFFFFFLCVCVVCVCVCVCFPAMNLVDLKTVLLSLKTKMFLWCHFSQVDTLLDLIIWTILWCLFLLSEADANIRDYSGKKAKQYLKNSASSRAQRKQFLSYCQASGDLIITPRPNTGNSRGRGSGIVHLSMTETQLEDGWTLVWWMSYCTGPAAALPVSYVHFRQKIQVSLETENVQMFPFWGFVWKSVWKQNVQASICRLCMVGLSVSMQEKLSCLWQSCAGSVFTNGEQKELVLWGYRHLRHLLLCSWHQRHRLTSTKWQLPWLLPST